MRKLSGSFIRWEMSESYITLFLFALFLRPPWTFWGDLNRSSMSHSRWSHIVWRVVSLTFWFPDRTRAKLDLERPTSLPNSSKITVFPLRSRRFSASLAANLQMGGFRIAIRDIIPQFPHMGNLSRSYVFGEQPNLVQNVGKLRFPEPKPEASSNESGTRAFWTVLKRLSSRTNGSLCTTQECEKPRVCLKRRSGVSPGTVPSSFRWARSTFTGMGAETSTG